MNVPREAIEKAVNTKQANLDAIIEWMATLSTHRRKFVWELFTSNSRWRLRKRLIATGYALGELELY